MPANKKNVLNSQLLIDIKQFINDYYTENNKTPTIRSIAEAMNIGSTTAHKYINRLKETGEIEYSANKHGSEIRTDYINKVDKDGVMIGLVGSVSCGPLTFAEQNITDYFRLPASLVGKGEFYMLEAYGNSMIKAGINNGDYVIIKKQNTAEDGQIVVALDGEETTLKRFYKDTKNKRFRLHPENDEMEDMYVDEVIIQGIAVGVYRRFE